MLAKEKLEFERYTKWLKKSNIPERDQLGISKIPPLLEIILLNPQMKQIYLCKFLLRWSDDGG